MAKRNNTVIEREIRRRRSGLLLKCLIALLIFVSVGMIAWIIYETQFKGAMEIPEETEPEGPIGLDGGGSYGGPRRVRRRAAQERVRTEEELAEMHEDLRFYTDPYEEFQEKMLRENEVFH